MCMSDIHLDHVYFCIRMSCAATCHVWRTGVWQWKTVSHCPGHFSISDEIGSKLVLNYRHYKG